MNKLLLVLTFSFITIPSFALDLRGSAGIETRYFTSDQEFQSSVFIEPEAYWQNEDASNSITFKPFVRADELDSERSHLDIREFFYQYASDNLELRAGINKIYWGVTESQHLVDVINQTDSLEGFDGEDKLGQPMLQLTFIQDWGVVDAFILPYFREKAFPGKDGHFNFSSQQIINNQTVRYSAHFNDAIYESSAEEKHVDATLRYSHSFGDWDFGLSYFDGTQRDPFILLSGMDNQKTELIFTPYYAQMQQLGMDLQATLGSWLWKMEVISRETRSHHFTAVTAGFEYTFYGVSEAGADLGLLAEINKNDRNEIAMSPAEHDLFIGGRYTWNDEQSSDLLFGISQDLDNPKSYSGKLEANRRLGNSYKLGVEAWFFNSDDQSDPIYAIRDEDFMQLSLEYYF